MVDKKQKSDAEKVDSLTLLILLPVSCLENYKTDEDGMCHSTTCILRNDPDNSFIDKEGCDFFNSIIVKQAKEIIG
jgi:hypothetical protein